MLTLATYAEKIRQLLNAVNVLINHRYQELGGHKPRDGGDVVASQVSFF